MNHKLYHTGPHQKFQASGFVRLIFIFALLPLYLSVTACGTAESFYKLGELNPTFADFEGSDLDPLQARPIGISETGIKKYDDFFRDIKKLVVTVDFTRGLIERLTLKIKNKEDSSKEELALEQIYNSWPELKKLANGLGKRASKLSKSAKGDFAGVKALELPTVLANLADAGDEIVNIGKAMPELVTNMQAIMDGKGIAKKGVKPGDVVAANKKTKTGLEEMSKKGPDEKNELNPEKATELKKEMREKVRAELRKELREDLRRELREEMREKVRQELRKELAAELKKETKKETKKDERTEVARTRGTPGKTATRGNPGVSSGGVTGTGNNPAVRQIRSPIFRDENNGLVLDLENAFLWQKCGYGQNYTAGSCAGVPGALTWESAVTYCKGLKLQGRNWRLPGLDELKTLIKATGTVRIDPVLFPASRSDSYWTALDFDQSPEVAAWVVDFSNGSAFPYGKVATGYVRCVSDR